MKHIIKVVLLILPFFSYSQFENFDYSQEWCTYFHSQNNDLTVLNSCIDDSNNIYIVGTIGSQFSLYTDPNSIYNHHGTNDGFIAKFNSSGSLVWFRNYGGSLMDDINHIKFKNENLYIVGSTRSLNGNLIASNALDGDSDGFISKLDLDGNIVWNKLIGGNLVDNLLNFDVSIQGDIYVVGESYSTSNLTTSNSFEEFNPNGLHLPFIAKLDNQGNKVWATYYGNINLNFLRNIAIGNTGIYMLGTVFSNATDGLTYFATAGSHKPVANVGADLFLAKFDFNGNRVWGTYFGELASDTATGNNHLVVDNDMLYFCATTSNNGLSTPGSFQENIGGSISFVICKMNNLGTVQWSTYSGIANPQLSNFILSSAVSIFDNNLYVNGKANLSDMATPGSYKETLTLGDSDAFLMKYDFNGNKLWGTYFGLESPDGARNAYFSGNNFYLLGNTDSDNLSTQNAFQSQFNNGNDNFLTKFSIQNLSNNTFNLNDISIYPNPFKDNISINAVDKIESIRVFDVLGKEVISISKIDSLNIDLQLNILNSGVYILEVNLINNKKSTKKIIKTN